LNTGRSERQTHQTLLYRTPPRTNVSFSRVRLFHSARKRARRTGEGWSNGKDCTVSMSPRKGKQRSSVKWVEMGDGKVFSIKDYDFTEADGNRRRRGRPKVPFASVVSRELAKALNAIASVEFGKRKAIVLLLIGIRKDVRCLARLARGKCFVVRVFTYGISQGGVSLRYVFSIPSRMGVS
jgi:hypothetical protein